jgi:uncharacterized membrane protein
MRPRAATIWESLRESYWFVPAVMLVAAAGLAFTALWLDVVRGAGGGGLLYGGGADGARAVLETVAGSMITVAGVVFSITIVALTLASNQFGPRLLRNYMRDRGNHLTLGTFVATFLYCLLVLRAVRSEGTTGGEFVPHVSVTVAVGLAVASLGVLVFYIHHVAAAIQAPNVIAAVAGELQAAIDRLYPERIGEPAREADEGAHEVPRLGEAAAVRAPASGYLQVVDGERLMRTAAAHDLVIEVCAGPGGFVGRGETLARVAPGARRSAAVEAAVADAFVLGAQRTLIQDLGFAFEQIVEVAVRALSSGINDPFTATTALDRLRDALCRLAGRKTPSPHRVDAAGRVRVIARPMTFAEAVDVTFGTIRHYARSSPRVLVHLAETIGLAAEQMGDEAHAAVLRRHVALVERDGRAALADSADLPALEAALVRAREALDRARARPDL